jgi:hypothetical protein
MHVIEGRTGETRSRGGMCKQLLDDVEEKRRYCNLKEDGLDRTLSGELALEGDMDLSQNRISNEYIP